MPKEIFLFCNAYEFEGKSIVAAAKGTIHRKEGEFEQIACMFNDLRQFIVIVIASNPLVY